MKNVSKNLLYWFGLSVLLGGHAGLQAQTESVPELIAVDHHVHLLSETLIADWKSLGMPFGKENPHYCDPETVLNNVGAKQAFAISMAHLYTSEWFRRLENVVEREAELVRAENDFIADCVARHPDRMVGFFSINPLRDYSRQEMDRCLQEKAFHGMKLHFPACAIDLVEDQHFEALSKVFQWSQENEVAILIHPCSGSETLAQVERFWSLVEKHSGLTIIIAHNGTSGGYSDVSHMMLSGFLALKEKALKAKADPFDSSNIYFDLSGAVLLEETDGMPATTDTNCQRLAAIMPRVGWDRFLYASDYPVFTRDQMKTLLHDKLKLTPDQMAQIMRNRVSSLKWLPNPASDSRDESLSSSSLQPSTMNRSAHGDHPAERKSAPLALPGSGNSVLKEVPTVRSANVVKAVEDWGPADPKTGLRLRLTLAESSVPAGKPVLGKLELRNSGKDAAKYDPQSFAPFRVVHIFDEKGNPASFIGPRPQTSGSAQQLAPGESVILWENVDLSELYLLDSGNYEVAVVFIDRQRELALESGLIRLKVDEGRLAPNLQLLKQLREFAPADWSVSTSFGAIYLSHSPTNLKQDVTTIQLWFTDEPLPADYKLGEGKDQQQVTTIAPTELGLLHLAAPKKADELWPQHKLLIRTAAARVLNFNAKPAVQGENETDKENDSKRPGQ